MLWSPPRIYVFQKVDLNSGILCKRNDGISCQNTDKCNRKNACNEELKPFF